MKEQPMKIVVDTREQAPYPFNGKFYLEKSPGLLVSTGTLKTGDYSIVGLEGEVAVERKELNDLIGCLGVGRERFEKELARTASFHAFAVVVEASWQDVAQGRYTSNFNPHSALQSILAFMSRYMVPFIFAGGRTGGEYATWGFLRQYLRNKEKIIDYGKQ